MSRGRGPGAEGGDRVTDTLSVQVVFWGRAVGSVSADYLEIFPNSHLGMEARGMQN